MRDIIIKGKVNFDVNLYYFIIKTTLNNLTL